MTNFFNLTLTVAAYTNTEVGYVLRSIMVYPIEYFDAPLAMYIVQHLHF